MFESRSKMKIKSLMVVPMFVLCMLTGQAFGAEQITALNGKKITVLTKALGTTDRVVDVEGNQKVYAWGTSRTGFEYAGGEGGVWVRPTKTSCVLQVLTDKSGTIKDALIDGEVYACATLRKKLPS